MVKKPNIFIRIISCVLFVVLLPLLILVWIVKGIIKHAKYKRWKKEGETGKKLILSSDITKIDIMEGYEFEEYLKCLFFYDDYTVEVTKQSRDYGADLILTRDEQKIVVQAKRYNNTVGSKCVAEIVGAIKHYNATEGWVVTNSYFSSQAETLAKDNSVRLIDRDELMELSREVCDKLRINNNASDIVQNQAYGETRTYNNDFRI